MLLFFISDISHIFSISNTFFHIFSPSSWKSNRHVCQRSRGIQKNMDSWNSKKSWCENKTKQSSRQIRCLYTKIWKSCGIFQKGATAKFAKTILFFLRRDPYSIAKTIKSKRRCNLGDCEGLQVLCKLKLVGHRKFIDLLQYELIKLKEI